MHMHTVHAYGRAACVQQCMNSVPQHLPQFNSKSSKVYCQLQHNSAPVSESYTIDQSKAIKILVSRTSRETILNNPFDSIDQKLAALPQSKKIRVREKKNYTFVGHAFQNQ